MGHEGSPQVYSGMNITLRLLSLGRAVHTIVQTLCVKTPPTTQRKHSQTGRKGSETSRIYNPGNDLRLVHHPSERGCHLPS